MADIETAPTLQTWNDKKVVKDYMSSHGISPGEVRILAEAWPCINGGDVLDIGVGAGRTIPYVSAAAARYIAIDYAEEMVAASRSRFPGIDVRQGDARQLAFKAGEFSFVLFSFNGIDYIRPNERELVLREIHRVLRPGGLFAFSTHNLGIFKQGKPEFVAQRPRPTWNLPKFAVRCARTWLGNQRARRNFARLKSQESWGENVAYINDGAYEYSQLTCYVDPKMQVEVLARIGFSAPILFVGENGKPASLDGAEPWPYFLVRR